MRGKIAGKMCDGCAEYNKQRLLSAEADKRRVVTSNSVLFLFGLSGKRDDRSI